MKDHTKDRKLKKLPMEYLWDGLVLSDNIYNYNGTVLLIPSGEVITEARLLRLANFNSGNKCITTYNDSYEIIMSGKDAPEEVRQRILENQSGYTGLRLNVDRMLQMTRNATRLKASEVESVMSDVFEKLYEIAPQDIFQCIDVPRPMDEKLQRHCLNVAFLNGLMGQWMHLGDDEIRMLVMTGVLHDVGKTKIPEEILYAPRKLKPEEFEIMKLHPVYSYRLLGNEIQEEVRVAVLHHHEKLNGNGYPDGIAGDQITFFTRITAITDVYDAMVSERSYKEAKMPLDVLEEFAQERFEGLDTELVKIFVFHMIKFYKGRETSMSDGTTGKIAYIPPNDICHPIVATKNRVKQTDDEWYCVRLAR